ncbi:unnamed protein product [Somion occarium]|uniref:Integral membrane protein n=1 Tax=Somion occarium TaxID=3059160 RepID=A0ABP1DR50_9APHY
MFVIGAMPGQISITIIMILRVYAMYNCNRRVLIALFSAFALEVGALFTLIIIVASRLETIEVPYTSGCFPVNTRQFAYAFWIPKIVFELTLFVLAGRCCLQEYYKRHPTPQLLNVLLRDSVAFFGGIFVFNLSNCLIWAISRPTLFVALPVLQIAFESVLGCRLLLNLKETANPWLRYDSAIYGMHSSLSSSAVFAEYGSDETPAVFRMARIPAK